MCVCVCACVCVRERQRETVHVSECEIVCVYSGVLIYLFRFASAVTQHSAWSAEAKEHHVAMGSESFVESAWSMAV